MNTIVRLACALVLLPGLVLPALAGDQSAAELQSRVSAYWTAVESQDWRTTYSLEKAAQLEPPPDPFQYYQAMGSGQRLRVARIEQHEQDGDLGSAVVVTSMMLPLGQHMIQIPRPIKTKWERMDGIWYHVESAAMTAVDESEPDDAPALSEDAPEGDASPGQPPALDRAADAKLE